APWRTPPPFRWAAACGGDSRMTAASVGRSRRAARVMAPAPRSEGADETLDPLVVGLERVLAEDGLALGVVELEVHPVHPVVLALEVGLADELTAQAGATGLGGGGRCAVACR